MFTAKVYRVMVCSLSGTMEEVFVAKDAIRKWNQENAERAGKVYLLVEDTTHQEDADVLIGVVGNWVEKTNVVEAFFDAGKRVMLFFNGYHDPKNTMLSEEQDVDQFRSAFQEECLIAEYRGMSELRELIEANMESK